MNLYKIKVHLVIGFFAFSFLACRKFVEVEPPKTTLIRETVFKEDITALAAMNSVYSLLYSTGFASGTTTSVTYLAGLSSDELQLFSTNQDQVPFATNSLLSTASSNAILWVNTYATLYRVNAILEGIKGSTTLSASVKQQLEGESKFVRAFCYFYLVNLYGGIPLSVTTDYEINRVLPRASADDVYALILKDLKDAQNLLLSDYSAAEGERVKPNKWAATALLARAYLYRQDWENAEIEAGKIISNVTTYELQPAANVFLKNSKEAIWQFNNNALNTNESNVFIFTTRPTNAALYKSFFDSFEGSDQRKANWILAKTSAGITYYQLNKYKAPRTPPAASPTPTEYSMVLRLAEQFLIRAEARAWLGKITGTNSAETDLNVVRSRAGVGNTTATTKETMLLAIESERFFELFGEWGHRWLDLKRTTRATAILGPLKGSSWQADDQLYPIPGEQITNNPSMHNAQNPGYPN